MLFWKRIGHVFSLTFVMTGTACWLFALSSYAMESILQLIPWQIDDGWTWLILPSGAVAGLILWLQTFRKGWIHGFGAVLFASLVLAIVWTLSRETRPGNEGLAIALGKVLALAMAYVASVTGAVCLGIATIVVTWLSWRGDATDPVA